MNITPTEFARAILHAVQLGLVDCEGDNAENKEVMSKLTDIAGQLKALAAQDAASAAQAAETSKQAAKAQAEIATAMGALIQTVATQTDKIAELEAAIIGSDGDTPADVQQAFDEAKAASDNVKVATDQAKAATQALDDLNPDAAPTPATT